MKRYLKHYFLGLLILAVPAVVPWVHFHRVGEYRPLDEVVHRQLGSEEPVLYGTALFSNFHPYKQELLSQASPAVVAMGSSRVMQMRESAFTQSFLNIGGAMGSIDAGRALAPDVIAKEPGIVLLGIDFWWFNQDRAAKARPFAEVSAGELDPAPNLSHSLEFWKWLASGKLPAGSLFESTRHLGLSGQFGDGFAPDGSYYYTRLITGQGEAHDFRFEDTLDRIARGRSRFEYGTDPDQECIRRFVGLVEELRTAGVEVVLFFPPLAGAVNQRMAAMPEKYAYIPSLRKTLSEAGMTFADYTDASRIGSSDCEFIDGFHGGEVTYLRILKDLANKHPSVAEAVDLTFVEHAIAAHGGLAFVPDARITPASEVDFLGLGCAKPGERSP